MLICFFLGLEIDESEMTGEKETVKPCTDAPFILSGTVVVKGSAKCLVCAVGKYSLLGSAIPQQSNCLIL